jgi:hypothetical protein
LIICKNINRSVEVYVYFSKKRGRSQGFGETQKGGAVISQSLETTVSDIHMEHTQIIQRTLIKNGGAEDFRLLGCDTV